MVLKRFNIKSDSLYGKIVPLTAEHQKYLTPDSASHGNRIKVSDKKYALIEVHLYTNSASFKNQDLWFSAGLSSFYRADVYEFDSSETTIKYITSSLGGSISGSFYRAVYCLLSLSSLLLIVKWYI